MPDLTTGVMPFYNTNWILMILYMIHHGIPLPNEHLTLSKQEVTQLSARLIASLSHSLAGGAPDAKDAALLKSSPVLHKMGIQMSAPDAHGVESITVAGVGTVSLSPMRTVD